MALAAALAAAVSAAATAAVSAAVTTVMTVAAASAVAALAVVVVVASVTVAVMGVAEMTVAVVVVVAPLAVAVSEMGDVTVAAELGAVSERALVEASAEVVAVDGAMAGTSAPSPSSPWFCTRLPPPSHSPRLSPCLPVLASLHSALPLHPWTARPPLRLLELGPSPGGGVVVSLRWRGGGARAARVFVRPSPPR
jgi:hypothetical protein